MDRAVKTAKLAAEEQARELSPMEQWEYYNQLAEWAECQQDLALMVDRPEVWGQEDEED